jgi:SAM-dependent methyltransferase
MSTVDGQAALWNGVGGHAWVQAQGVLDGLLEPLQRLLLEAVEEGPAGPVLDVGCGTGGTTVAIARARGACTGIDISEPMVAAARIRAERAGVPAVFVHADAQRHRFAPAGFATIASRFGVMFFDDPVAAFTNLRAAAVPGAALRFIAWRGAEENPFMTTAERAAAPLITLPARNPDEPGQFAFADGRRVRDILTRSGWGGVDLRPVEVTCAMPEADLSGYLTRLGPLGRALADADEATRARIVAAVRPAFDRYVSGGEVRVTAACWLVAAQAS